MGHTESFDTKSGRVHNLLTFMFQGFVAMLKLKLIKEKYSYINFPLVSLFISYLIFLLCWLEAEYNYNSHKKKNIL